MSTRRPDGGRVGARQRWLGVAVGVGGLLLVASLVLPWIVVRSAATVGRERFFLLLGESATPTTPGIALAAVGILAVLAGGWSALGRPVPRAVHIVLASLLLAAFISVVVPLAGAPRVDGVGELTAIRPSSGLLFALAGPLLGAAGSLALALGRRTRRARRA